MTETFEILCDEVVEAFLEALNQRENELAGHNRRVAQLAVRLGQALGLTEQELSDLRRGALLHDIGKLGVPDAILQIPGQLTAEEYKIVQGHTHIGASILRHIRFLGPASAVAESHHERWDGTGYPQGLRGEAIPLLARISAVAGVYDALTSERSYKPAWPRDQALQWIVKGAGSAYDPQVVRAFVRVIQNDGEA